MYDEDERYYARLPIGGVMAYVVIESTPGYMPESDPAEFETFEDAFSYALELATELEDAGYEIVGVKRREIPRDADGILWSYKRADTISPDLGRVITIDRTED